MFYMGLHEDDEIYTAFVLYDQVVIPTLEEHTFLYTEANSLVLISEMSAPVLIREQLYK